MTSITKAAIVIGLLFGLLLIGEQIVLHRFCEPAGTTFIHKFNQEFQNYDCGKFTGISPF